MVGKVLIMVFKKIRMDVHKYSCARIWLLHPGSVSLDARNHTAEVTLAQPSLAFSRGLGVESGLGGLEQKLSNAVV